MRYRTGLILMAVLICIVSIGAERREPVPQTGEVNLEAHGFQVMHTTAYVVGHHTANGSPVHSGGCACSIDHIGDIAILYTLNGHFLGYYECNDTGAEGGGVRAGRVIDVYRCNMTHATGWMKLTGGKVYVKWITGNG